ncbi:MAG: lipopolysaccharide transport system ATP-binding protein [Solirubrobacteraceae bacterium]|jgi:ABC-type polysaccharide/polyol phosphate transport system ATPase subunit|nr:lipopolysaccharide transport system ATP-binding protein [Solirubrobacteraceae bacterium]
MTSLPTSDSAVIVLDHVSVRYRLSVEPRVSLKEAIVRFRRRTWIDYPALSDISLSIAKGEILGIIGKNGAGKTTLLNLLARVIDPAAGRLRIRGAVSQLIDLMSGFHPDLTGRENAYLRGAFLGLTRAEMHARMPGIEAFAVVGDFFDAPLRSYSAGMILRVAFAVATTVDSDILLIDEALGVGDAEFQQKCAARIAEFRARGVTFVVVSHDLQRLTNLCDRVAWIDGGAIRQLGTPGDVISAYIAAYA